MPEALRPRSLPDLVHRSVTARPEAEALRWKETDGDWRALRYRELWDAVARVSLALRARGIGPGDRVVILSRSRPEWVIADLATLALGAVVCPFYPGESAGRMREMLRQLEPKLLFVETARLLQRLETGSPAAGLPPVVLFEPEPARPMPTLAGLARDDPAPDQRQAWEAGWQAISSDDLATIPFTLGEDGEPRGVLLSHGNVVHNLHAASQALDITAADRALSVLPLSHMLERGAGVYVPLGVGGTVVFAERRMERWASNLVETQPTVMICVPPFFTQIERHIRAEVAASGPPARWLVSLTERLAAVSYVGRLAGRRDPWWLRVALGMLRAMVGRPLRRATGGRLRFFISGGAPLARSTGRLFHALGVEILEGYGLTETAPLLSVNRPGAGRIGTVGPPVAATELRIDPANGEVLARGPQVMRGYLARPELTASVLAPDGWLRTGDRGAIGPDGHLRITGLIKEIVVLATGKKVGPLPLEAAICASPLIRRAVVVGNGQESPGVLLVPETDLGGGRAGGGGGDAAADAAADTSLRARLAAEVDRLTAGFAPYERPRHVAILPRDLSAELGELRPDGRPNRAAVCAAFPGQVRSLFVRAARPGPERAGQPRPDARDAAAPAMLAGAASQGGGFADRRG